MAGSSEDHKCIEIHPKCAKMLTFVIITQLPSFSTKLWREHLLAKKLSLEQCFAESRFLLGSDVHRISLICLTRWSPDLKLEN